MNDLQFTDVQQERELDEQTRRAHARLLEAYRALFESTGGKLVLKDLAERCGAKSDGYYPDSDRTAYMCGARGVYLYIEEMLSTDPEEFRANDSDNKESD